MRSHVFIVAAMFAVLTFAVDLVPHPAGSLFQLFTAFFITMASLIVRRHGTATFVCLIAGLLDAFYTGLPAALFLFLVRGGTFDLFISTFRAWKGDPPHLIKISAASAMSSTITGLTTYIVIVEGLKIMVMPFHLFTIFIVASTILSSLGAALAVRTWRMLPPSIKRTDMIGVP